MQNLIDGILHYSRMANNKTEKETVKLSDVIANIIDLLSVPNHVRIEYPDQLPTLFDDDGRGDAWLRLFDVARRAPLRCRATDTLSRHHGANHHGGMADVDGNLLRGSVATAARSSGLNWFSKSWEQQYAVGPGDALERK